MEDGDTATEDAYRTWCEESVIDLPPVPPGSIKYASLACGHTNTCLRAIKWGCRSTHPVLSDGTHYNMDNVMRKDAKLGNAAVNGLWFLIIEPHVLVKHPALIRVFDASRNVAPHVAAPESESTGMNKLYLKWAKDEADGKTGSYVKYLAEILRPRPPWAGSVQHMVPFLQNHAGGIEGVRWEDFQTRHSHSIPSGTRQMAGAIFQALAAVKDSELVYAVLYAAYNCPEDKVINKFCSQFSVGDINKLAISHTATDDQQKREEQKCRHGEE